MFFWENLLYHTSRFAILSRVYVYIILSREIWSQVFESLIDRVSITLRESLETAEAYHRLAERTLITSPSICFQDRNYA